MKILFFVSVVILSGCATINKCGAVKELENSVYSPSTCQVYIRQTIYLDQISGDAAEKIKQGELVELNWVPAKTNGSKFVPAHAEISNDGAGGGK